MSSSRRIVAIGGGGFSMDKYSLAQERYLLALVQSPRPNVLFLGTASGDGERYQLRFFRTFAQLPCSARSFVCFPPNKDLDPAVMIREADLVFVGGGNTVAMLAVWRELGMIAPLREAYDRGCVLAGISAGANVWFERYVTDSVPGGGVREGLGWLKGTFCPHLDSETWRQPILQGTAGLACGAGEGVAVLYENERLVDVVREPGSDGLCLVREASTLEPRTSRAL